MKQALLAVAIIGLLVRVYFVYHGTQVQTAAQTLKSQQGIAEIRHNMQGSAKDAGEAVPGATAAPKQVSATPTGSPDERQEIDAALKTMHLTTIMPGQPGQVIIDKQDYSEGESVPLPKGRKARIVAVQDDGVQLVCNGMTFHLDAPTGPDLAALRKKK